MTDKKTKINLVCNNKNGIPKCEANLAEVGVTYVEEGCTNYINYALKGQEWIVDSKSNGENATDCYYICGLCQQELSAELQEYFTNNV